MADSGCTVVAPHVPLLASPRPTGQELSLRARRLRLALDLVARADLPAVGIGHSIGATLLLALAGGELWLEPRAPLPIAPDPRLSRLALMAPATDFFQGPGALANLRAPLLVMVGTNDAVTPPSEVQRLQHAVGGHLFVDLRLIEGAGHFSFMDTLPPGITDPLPERDVLLRELALVTSRFLLAKPDPRAVLPTQIHARGDLH